MEFIRKIFNKFGFYFLFLIIGFLIFFYPMILSGFDLMPGRGEYSKYFNYILEHSWLWLKQAAPNYYFWSAPFSYPMQSTTALSDSLLGIAPFYWILRFSSINPFSSFQILIVFLCFLNYTTFYYLLNKKFKFSTLASSVSSFIFAFSLMRYFRMDEINYYSQFYTILAIIFLLSVNKTNSRMKNHFWFILFSISIILQFYSCFTLGFFACFIGIVGIFVALLPKTGRDCIIDFFKNYYKLFLFYILVIFLMLLPLSYNIVCTGVIKSYEQLIINVSNFMVWIRNLSVLDSLFFKDIYYVGYLRNAEFSTGVGIFTLIFSLIGIWKIKYSKGVPIILLIFIFLISCGYSAMFLWKILYFVLMGSEKIDSPVKVSFIALIILAFGIGVLIQYLQNNIIKNKILTVIILISTVLLLTVEQISYIKDENSAWINYGWSKKQFIVELNNASKKIKKDCKIIDLKYVPFNFNQFGNNDIKIKKIKMKKQENLFAMWLSIINNKRTVNSFLTTNNTSDKTVLVGVCKVKIPSDLSKL